MIRVAQAGEGLRCGEGDFFGGTYFLEGELPDPDFFLEVGHWDEIPRMIAANNDTAHLMGVE